jgi:hypothetical protein
MKSKFFFVLAALLAGCSSSQSVDLVSRGLVQARSVPSDSVQVAPPSVSRSGDKLIVSGEVVRKGGDDSELAGRVRIAIHSNSGVALHEMVINLQSADVNRKFHYEMESDWLPHTGAIFLAEFSPINPEIVASARSRGGIGVSSGHSGVSVSSGHHGGSGK